MADVELKKKLLEVNNITLEAALDKVRKWEAAHVSKRSKWLLRIKSPEQALMWLGKPREMDTRGTLAKRVLIVAKRGTLLGTGVARLEEESVQNVISMVIMLAVAKEGKA